MAEQMAARKVFADSVRELPRQDGLTPRGLMLQAAEPMDKQAPLDVLFTLAVPAEAQQALEDAVAKGEVASAEMEKNAQPSPEQIERLTGWLKGQGFEVTQVSPGTASVYARASADQIEKSLDVNMVQVTKNGVTHTAAANAPSLPADVGEGVDAILGLQPYRRAHKNSRCIMPRPHRVVAPAGHAGQNGSHGLIPAAAPQVDTSTFSPPYKVSDILHAYGGDGVAETGKDQTIAILIDTVPLDSDLEAFWQANNLNVTLGQVETINVNNVTLPPAEGEETLDVSWSSGIAPDATIRIYASGSLSFVDLDRALDQIIQDLPNNPGLKQLSISLGLGEQYMAKSEVTTQHLKYLRLAAAGVNVFVSSGDAGSNPDDTGHSSTGPTQAEYGSSDSAVIGVGGTSMVLADDGSLVRERAWTGSGGGTSVLFPRPAWQTGNGVPAGAQRLVPDVSLSADPNEGAYLVLQGKEIGIGGTSWSAPMWAGICALLNERRVSAGKATIGFLNPLLYPLNGNGAFRDIQAGTNGAFSAGVGYDQVTGLGVPNIADLMNALS